MKGEQAPVVAFDHAEDYDAHGHVQRQVAAWLADRLRDLPRPARLLEVGAGTGFLRRAAGALADDWLLTDLSPAMLARARGHLGDAPDLRYRRLDAAHPDIVEPPFDIVTGSLVVQWFADLPDGLARLFALVAPGGRLVVTTLAAGSFAEWRQAHADEALTAATHPYPTIEALAALRLGGIGPTVAMRTLHDRYPDGRAFLRALKAIGAGTPRPGHRPLGPAALGRVLRRWEANGCSICYRVAMLTFSRPAA